MVKLKFVPLLLLLALVYSSCGSDKEKKSVPVKKAFPGPGVAHLLDSHRYERAWQIVQNGSRDVETAEAVELYYTLMDLAYSAYETSLQLNRINLVDYLSREEEADKRLIWVYKFFLGYNYFLQKQDEKAKQYFIDLSEQFPSEHPLYPRVKILVDYFSGDQDPNEEIPDMPVFLAYRLGLQEISSPGNLFQKAEPENSLNLLDQAMVACTLGNRQFLDRVFSTTCAPAFYYVETSTDGVETKIYNPESLLLTAVYFSFKVEVGAQALMSKSPGLSHYYLGRVNLLRGEYRQAITHFRKLLDSGVMATEDERLIMAIVDGISGDAEKGEYKLASIDVSNKALLPAVKYWYYRHQAEPENHETTNRFFEWLDREFKPILMNEEYQVPAGVDRCEFKELFITVGRYFLSEFQVNRAEKYFFQVFHQSESFTLKDNESCGLIFDYHPTTFLAYSALALVHHPRLKSVVLQSIKNESTTNPLYRIPSEILSDIFSSLSRNKSAIRQ